jgi:hypothetical protein
MKKLLRPVLPGLLALSAWGCTSRVQSINVKVLTKACTSPTDPSFATPAAPQVDRYVATVTGTDLTTPLTLNFSAGSGATLDKIPAGADRVLKLVGYASDQPVLMGQSAPFTVPDSPAANPLTVNIFLRQVNAFSGAATAADPTKCAELLVPRAGHTASLLQDGRILFLGGYSGPAGLTAADYRDELPLTFHDEAEIFDPKTGAVTPAATMAIPNSVLSMARAFHSASLLPDGEVLVIGGEGVQYGDHHEPVAINEPSVALAYNPVTDTWVGAEGSRRSRHQAVVDSKGRVLLLGGVVHDNDNGGALTMVQDVTFFDPRGNGRFVYSNALPDGGDDPSQDYYAVGFAAAGAFGSQVLLAAGGDTVQGSFTAPDVSFFQYTDPVTTLPDGGSMSFWPDGGDLSYVSAGSVPSLHLVGTGSPSRHGLAGATFGPAQDHLLFGGGFTTPDYLPDGGLGDARATASVVDLKIGDANSSQSLFDSPTLTEARGDLCAAALADGRVLFAGGYNGTSTSKAAELYALTDAAASVPATVATLIQSRRFHTCTALPDGTVVIAGGLSAEGGTLKVLNSIEVFQPAPQ